MSGAGNEVKQLRHRENEIEHLRDEKQKHGLAEVSQDGNHCKRHPREITKGVPDKYAGWIPARKKEIMLTQTADQQSDGTLFNQLASCI